MFRLAKVRSDAGGFCLNGVRVEGNGLGSSGVSSGWVVSHDTGQGLGQGVTMEEGERFRTGRVWS